MTRHFRKCLISANAYDTTPRQTKKRKVLFSQIVIIQLNDMPLEVKDAKDVPTFKILYDKLYTRWNKNIAMILKNVPLQ